MSTNRCNVLLVSPKYPLDTFWNNKAICRLSRAHHTAIPLGLLTVAALLPPGWTCRMVDRNVRDVTEADLAWADLIMTGGMNVQRLDCLDFITWAQARGKVVAVGGPDVTSEPDFYGHADFIVLGEAEVIIQEFIAAWEAGQRRGTFKAEKFKVDVARSPVPRFDLVRRTDYLYFAVQFSRGCPFNCEFCDIIELYGRNPRVKSPEQMIGELDALYRAGYRGHVDFVDDNFIGNKRAVKRFLPYLIAWQEERDYPFMFSTEASVNLADDDELLELMRQARFFVVFVGIESPNGDTLVAMQKKQNARRNLAKSVHKIYHAGMFVIAGFIVGFDAERGSIAEEMVQCIEDSAIAICMVGLLTALANTQLTARLKQEGRMFPPAWLMQKVHERRGGDQCTLGLNFETLRPRRDVLADYKRVVDEIYSPRAYFGRLSRAGRHLRCFGPPLKPGAERVPQFAGIALRDWAALMRLMSAVLLKQPLLLRYYFKALDICRRENPGALGAVAIMCAFYLHLRPFSRMVSASIARQVNDIDEGVWQTPLGSAEHHTKAA